MLISEDSRKQKPWKFVMHDLPIDDRETIARYRPEGVEPIPTLVPVIAVVDGRLKQLNAEHVGKYKIVE